MFYKLNLPLFIKKKSSRNLKFDKYYVKSNKLFGLEIELEQ